MFELGRLEQLGAGAAGAPQASPYLSTALQGGWSFYMAAQDSNGRF